MNEMTSPWKLSHHSKRLIHKAVTFRRVNCFLFSSLRKRRVTCLARVQTIPNLLSLFISFSNESPQDLTSVLDMLLKEEKQRTPWMRCIHTPNTWTKVAENATETWKTTRWREANGAELNFNYGLFYVSHGLIAFLSSIACSIWTQNRF